MEWQEFLKTLKVHNKDIDGCFNDALAVRHLEQAISQHIDEENQKAFRAGQIDCREAGDPRNHKYFKEAVDEEVRAARAEERKTRSGKF